MIKSLFIGLSLCLSGLVKSQIHIINSSKTDSNMKTKENVMFADSELIKKIPGFTNKYVSVNGINIHYVEGGSGEPLILLPGWPQTWWSYHKIMPDLAKKYKVIVVDIRGMGSSDKPENGYEKKNIAKDIFELTKKLGLKNIFIAGHDIGASVAFSFAANFPETTLKLILLDTPPMDESIYKLPMLPAPGTSTEKVDPNGFAYPWWVAFNQVKFLPEQILDGRMNILIEWLFKYLNVSEKAMEKFDKEVYINAYNNMESIRSSNAWYQAFPQDVIDNKLHSKLSMPVLAIGGSGFHMLEYALPEKVKDLKLAEVKGGGHFLFEEKPKETSALILDFLQ